MYTEMQLNFAIILQPKTKGKTPAQRPTCSSLMTKIEASALTDDNVDDITEDMNQVHIDRIIFWKYIIS
jgi:hypothetical protein